MDMLCVHPAYWRKGHGTQLVKWTLNLARMDGITQGVNAAPMGARLYEALGYEIICIAREEGDEDDPLGVYTYVFKFGP
ncbi:hypothetical protein N7488_000894 [Penicillium malachiteum]|nr:hypothetical protein N7488_000894 [Penicillium malachiteum]